MQSPEHIVSFLMLSQMYSRKDILDYGCVRKGTKEKSKCTKEATQYMEMFRSLFYLMKKGVKKW